MVNLFMQTLVLVVRMLSLHRAINTDMTKACLGVIANFLEGESAKNKSHIIQMVDHIINDSVGILFNPCYTVENGCYHT